MPGELTRENQGLPRFLRAWRAAAGEKLGRSKPLSQAEVAHRAGMSDRWLRDMERGFLPRPDRHTMDRLAEALMLEPDQRLTLFLYTVGCPAPKGVTAIHDSPEHRALQLVINQQQPKPAYLSDSGWDLIAYNDAMADWFPWVRDKNANLMRWALIMPESRDQLLSWSSHARVYLAMLRLQLARYPEHETLLPLRDEILEDPVCRRLWEEDTQVVANRDGHHFRLRLPKFGGQEIDLISQVLIPANLMDLRLVLLTWPDTNSTPEDGGFIRPLEGSEDHEDQPKAG